MLQRGDSRQLDDYLARRRDFNRRKRKLRLGFDALYRLFASKASGAEIAKRAGVSKERINFVFNRHFSDLFGMTALERLRNLELEAKRSALRQLALAVERDRAIKLVRESAGKAPTKPKVEVVTRQKHPIAKGFRHKAVRVRGKIESVHHLRKARLGGRRRVDYASTTLNRSTLEKVYWTIFVVDVPGYAARVFRSKSRPLLQTFFSPKQERASVYIPLEGIPANARYDFLPDEDNWSA
jgi:hypothetical protein